MLRKIITAIFFVWTITLPSIAQRLPMVNYTTRFPVLAEGVLQIFQDSNGWIWMVSGTQVMRYDGDQLSVHLLAQGVEMDFCFQIMEIEGNIIIGSRPYPLMATGDSLVKAPAAILQFLPEAATIQNGLQFLAGKKGLATIRNGSLRPFSTTSFSRDLSTKLLVLQDTLLVSHLTNDSLLLWNLKNQFLYRQAIKVKDVHVDDKNGLLILTSDGLHQWKNLKIVNGILSMEDKLLYAEPIGTAAHICADREGNIWLTVLNDKIVKLETDGPPRKYYEKDINTSVLFNRIFCDRQNNIWVAQSNGAFKIPPDKSNLFTTDDGLSFNVAEQLIQSGEVFYANTIKGLNVFDKNKWKAVFLNGKPFKCQRILSYGGRFFSVSDKSLYQNKIDPITATVSSHKLLTQLPGSPLDMAADVHGNVYVSAHSGVYTVRNGKVAKLPLPDSSFKTLYVDGKNRLWCGQFGGELCVLQLPSNATSLDFKAMNWAPSISGAKPLAVRGIAEDKNGNVLVGTRFNGLYIFRVDDDTIRLQTHITTANGLPSNAVWDIAVDTANRYWLVNEGITLLKLPGDQPEILRVGKTHGIYRAFQLKYQSPDIIWVSTPNGVVSINPFEKNKHTVGKTSTTITSIIVNDERGIDTAISVIKLKSNDNNLLFHFSANSFLQEEQISYVYSFSDDGKISWTKPSTDNTVRISSVPPGDYVFRVKAFDQFGNELTGEDNVAVHIAPPFYASWWFISLCILLLLFVGLLLHGWRMRQLKKLMSVRSGISKNLHDDIGASLTNVLLLNEMAMNEAENGGAPKSLLSRATEDIKRIGDALGDIVWNTNPENDQIGNVLARMQRFAGEMLEGAGIEATLDFPEYWPDEKMKMEIRRDLYLIFKECIHNLVRHSQASSATIKVDVARHNLAVTITDNGKGFMMKETQISNGIKNMHHRTAKWQGMLVIESEPGSGTKVYFMLPFA